MQLELAVEVHEWQQIFWEAVHRGALHAFNRLVVRVVDPDQFQNADLRNRKALLAANDQRRNDGEGKRNTDTHGAEQPLFPHLGYRQVGAELEQSGWQTLPREVCIPQIGFPNLRKPSYFC